MMTKIDFSSQEKKFTWLLSKKLLFAILDDQVSDIFVCELIWERLFYIKDLSLALGQTDRIPLVLSVWAPVITLSLFTFVGVLQINEK